MEGLEGEARYTGDQHANLSHIYYILRNSYPHASKAKTLKPVSSSKASRICLPPAGGSVAGDSARSSTHCGRFEGGTRASAVHASPWSVSEPSSARVLARSLAPAMAPPDSACARMRTQSTSCVDEDVRSPTSMGAVTSRAPSDDGRTVARRPTRASVFAYASPRASARGPLCGPLPILTRGSNAGLSETHFVKGWGSSRCGAHRLHNTIACGRRRPGREWAAPRSTCRCRRRRAVRAG